MIVIGGIGVREVFKAVFPPTSAPAPGAWKSPQAGRGGVVEAPRGTEAAGPAPK